MKRLLCATLILCIIISLCACEGTNTLPASSISSEISDTPTAVDSSESDAEDDAAWKELESMGKIKTENGLVFVTITLPADFVGSEISQESIDAKAGEGYISGKLNQDGSVTYKLTKKQHKTMLDDLSKGFEDSLKEMVDSPDYAFERITHNDDFTSFDAYLSTEELGLTESFAVLGFYMYGGMYGIFTGRDAENISVNFYSYTGKLIKTANSSDTNAG